MYYLCLFAIIVLSYRFLSIRYYPLLNSDDALNVLMAVDYPWPETVYCWAQDRGGTLIPLISHVLIKVFNISPINATSLTGYFLIFIGFFCLARLIKSKFYRIILAVAWFFPFTRFVDLVRYPIALGYSLFALIIYLIDRYERNKDDKFEKHALPIAIILLSTIAIWVSDLTIVSLVILLSVLLLFFYIKNKTLRIRRSVFFYAVGGMAFATTMIFIAKSYATYRFPSYAILNDWNEIVQTLGIIRDTFRNILTYHNFGNWPETLYLYMTIPLFLFVILLLVFKKQFFSKLITNKWMVFFFVDMVVIFCIFIIAHWVFSNYVGSRYFVATYISLTMFVLIVLDNTTAFRMSNIVKTFMLLLVVVGGLTSLFEIKIKNGNFESKVDRAKEFEQLGTVGIIGNYWNSYVFSCANPTKIVATPNEHEAVRNWDIVYKVFDTENIHLIREQWLDSFPDTITQFGHRLVKAGDEFTIAERHACKYKKIAFEEYFNIENVQKCDSCPIVDVSDVKAVFVSQQCAACKEKNVINAKLHALGRGTYMARLCMKATNVHTDGYIGALRITHGDGRYSVLDAPFDKTKFYAKDDFTYIDIEFDIEKVYYNVDITLFYVGGADIYFKDLTLKERQR